MSGRAGAASPLTLSRGRSSRVPLLAGPLLAVAGALFAVAGPVVAGSAVLAAGGARELEGGPLVLRHHRRGVDRGRRVVARPGGQRLVRTRARHRRMPVDQRPARDAVRVVRLVDAHGFGAHDQLDVGPELLAADLDDVVGLLAQRPGDGPVAVHRDVHQGDAHAEVLDVGDDLGQVLLRADHQRVADRAVAGQRGQVPVDLGFHALATAGTDLGHPELDARDVGQGVLLGGAAAVDGRLVPVAAQQRQPGALAGHAAQQLQEPLVVPGDRFASAGPVHGHGTICEHVACVNEQRAAIHGPTVLSSAQRSPFQAPIRT